MIVLTFTAVFILFRFQSSKSDTVEWNSEWEEANNRCKSQNDSLVRIHDIHNHQSIMIEYSSIWSSVKGKYTPWIAYRGCYEGGLCEGHCDKLINNTIGNCYFHCKSNNYSEGGCADTEEFYFALQENLCSCLCDKTKLSKISESINCSLSCEQDINKGECGGKTFFSKYEVITVNLSKRSFRGFCLACRKQDGRIQLSSMECDATANGYCVANNNDVTAKDTQMSSFDEYWNRCKKGNLYIVGNTEYICQKSNTYLWTGLRKYIIESVKSDHNCYSIDKYRNTISYTERNCTESLPVICKQHIYTDVYSTQKNKNFEKHNSNPASF